MCQFLKFVFLSLHLQQMTNKAFISRLFLLVLLAMLVFQTKHSYDHFVEQLEAPICHHENTTSKKQITHAHHYAPPCSVCAYSVNSFLPPSSFFWENSEAVTDGKTTKFYFSSTFTFYSGSLFALRAPPVV